MIRSKSKYVFTNITVIDGSGAPKMENMAVAISEGKIASVTNMDKYVRRNEMREVDCTHKYIMPGLIDAHMHFWGGRTDNIINEMGYMLEPMQVKTLRSVADAQSVLKSGFTSVRDISRNGLFLKRVFAEGSLLGPRIVACGPGLCKTGGHVDLHQLPIEFLKDQWVILADGPEEIRKQVRLLLRDGADQIKLWISGGDCWPADRLIDTHYSYEEIEMAVKEAGRSTGTMVCAHCENYESMKIALMAGVNTIEHGEALNEELADLMVEKNAILVPTLAIQTYWFKEFVNAELEKMKVRPEAFLQRTVDDPPADDEEFVETVKEAFLLAKRKGVKIALGSDTVRAPAQKYGKWGLRELKALYENGMTVLEAIKAATKTAAEALGLEQRIGTIEAGKNADLLILKKDPSSDINVLTNPENIEKIIVNGNLVVENGKLCR